VRLNANSQRPERRSTDGQMILRVGLTGWKIASDLDLRAPIRNRTVGLLLYHGPPRRSCKGHRAPEQARRWLPPAAASTRRPPLARLCPPSCPRQTPQCQGLDRLCWPPGSSTLQPGYRQHTPAFPVERLPTMPSTCCSPHTELPLATFDERAHLCGSSTGTPGPVITPGTPVAAGAFIVASTRTGTNRGGAVRFRR
jgi:hypothetical protein